MRFIISICLLFVIGYPVIGQDTTKVLNSRSQLNSFLSRGSLSVNFGYIQYPYSNAHLNTSRGYQSESSEIPHFAARILLGYRINNNFSVHYSVMRAALWPSYKFLNDFGEVERHGIMVNEWGLTLRGQFPVNKNSHFFLEGGLGLLARNGFITRNDLAFVTDENYFTFLSCVGLKNKLSSNWEGVFMTTFSPPSKMYKQPYTVFTSLGFVYSMHKLSQETVAKSDDAPYIFPRQYVQMGFASNIAGFVANDMVSVSGNHHGIPIFWRGVIQTQFGGAITYQKNVFHTRKIFSFDWGTSMSLWQTEINKDSFYAISVFPVIRFWFLRNKITDNYFVYSVVGPTFISEEVLDTRHLGSTFTYQDFLGFGCFIGKHRNFNAEIKIVHYSNGNLFSLNPGVDVPLMLNVGYAFR